MPFSKKGFTLIELLVVIAIIALLSTIVMTVVKPQRDKAKNVNFQSTVKGIQAGVQLCCNNESANINDTLEGDICNPASGSIYPDSTHIGSVSVVRDCSNASGFSVRIDRPSTGGTITYALCDRDSCQFITE